MAFEATMKKEPTRFRSLYGGASAAATIGDRAKADAYSRRCSRLRRKRIPNARSCSRRRSLWKSRLAVKNRGADRVSAPPKV